IILHPLVRTSFCFFFQAEDGIRDFHVTGVQTCALPIWINPPYFDKLKVIVETFFHSVALISSISTGAARRAQPINLFSRSDYSGRARVLANRLRRFAALGLTSQNRPM